ncbi:MAG: hypothetical protein SGPRY_009904 [Prymnesium sp.]
MRELAALAESHARKRLRCEAASAEEAAERLLSCVLARARGGDAFPPTGIRHSLEDASASQNLLALLALAVGRPIIVHADDAANASEEEVELTDPVQPSGESPFSPRRPTITHSDLHLSTELVSQAQSADTLPLAVERLLDAGADANARDADSNTPLFLSVYVPDVRAALMVVHHLLRRGADPNSIRCGGTILNHALANSRANGYYEEALRHMRKALWAAANGNDARAVAGLLQHGCPAEEKLVFALVRKRRSLPCVTELLRAQADPNLTDRLGTHVLTIAVLQGEPLTSAFLNNTSRLIFPQEMHL